MPTNRRDFLSSVTAGTALVTMPTFLSSCGVDPATNTGTPTPANPFLEWFAVDEATLARVMSELTANGADTAELYFQHTRNTFLRLEDSLVNMANTRIEQGVGLRVVVGEQTGYAFSEDLTLQSMLAAARTAATIATGKASAPQAFSPHGMGDLYTIKLPWSDVGIDQKLPILQQIDDLARASDPSVNKVTATWMDADERVLIATLDGRLIVDHRPMTRLSAFVTAIKDGESQSGSANIAARDDLNWYTQERIKTMVKQAVDRTMIQFDAVRPPAGEMPVVLAAGASGILLHEAIGHGMEADFNRKGTSIYTDMIGKKVAEPFVNIIDQGTLAGMRGALNVDDEGNPCGRTELVENGILRSYLHDTISSRQYDVATTGSGRRQSYKFEPMPRMTCTFMENGPHTNDEIIAAVDHGIIAETYTNGQVRIGEGDYTFYVKNGWLIEKGKVTAPIRDVNIIGNGPEDLTRITMVADNAEMDAGGWTCGKNGQSVPVSLGMPSVLVSKMTVGGQNVS